MHLTERISRVGPDTLRYDFTIEDPTTWTSPWTASMPMRRMNEPIYEYACHEGNYGMINTLRGARVEDELIAEGVEIGERD